MNLFSPSAGIGDKRRGQSGSKYPLGSRRDTDSNVKPRRDNNKAALFFIATAVVGLGIYLAFAFEHPLRELLKAQMGGLGSKADTIVQVLQLVLLGILAYLIVRA
ncbi:MAG: hypothetical protein LC775_04070, partial [Acidobacteria bacterium]|nr:hypothetical protein [Acidobacteriota bacterium]